MKRALASLIFSLLLLTACAPTVPVSEDVLWHMDTAITVRLYGDPSTAQAALDNCDEILSEADRLLSATRADSPIAHFNASNNGKDVSMPAEVIALLGKAMDISQACGGAFDITTAPLSALWEHCENNNILPTAEQLSAALTFIGSDHLSLDSTVLTKDAPDVRIDLGGIGKGYAIDCLLAAMASRDGMMGGIISMGSNVAVFGNKPDASPWKIALRAPDNASAAVGYLHLTEGQILSVSGDYERYFTIDGAHYSHILDPKTGYPPENGLRSVAVLCSDGATADALSTALMVMGEDAARALYESGTLDFEAVFVYDDRVSTTEGVTLH